MSAEKTFEGSAVRLNYLDYGSPSEGPLMMLHGGAWRWQEYLSVIPSLGQRWHVHALDLRGHGRSGWVPEPYRLQDFTKDNVEFLDRLNAPAVLVGHSVGGAIALMVAAQRPDKVRAVIIEDAPFTLECYRREVESGRERFGRWLHLKRSAQSEADLALKLAEEYRSYPGLTSMWHLFFAGCLWQLDPTFFGALLNDFEAFIEGYDYKVMLPRINCPMLFLRGETKLGAVMTDDELSWLEQNYKNVRCRVFEGLGHLLHLEDHGQAPVLAEIMGFLETI
jgi:pimeloyl-ACP methyl ester carboxylesterase